MRVGVYTNPTKDGDLSVTKKVIELLHKINAKVFLFNDVKKHISTDFCNKFACEFFSFKKNPNLFALITIGGDGTVLAVAQQCLNYDIPILSINKGTKGFLTEVEIDDLGKLNDILSGNYVLDTRTLVDAIYDGKTFCALNEIFITRKSRKMITLNTSIGDLCVDKYSCDGMLISTPTGSTAYSLSAGGPVISPNAPVLCLTPVNSHSLHTRPVVVGDDEVILVKIETECDDVLIIADGFDRIVAKKGKDIILKKSGGQVKFLRGKDSSFYLKVITKLSTSI